MASDLQQQEDLIQLMASNCKKEDILSFSRKIGIPQSDFYVDTIPMRELSERFVNRAVQLGKDDELSVLFKERERNIIVKNTVSDKSAELFGKLLNHFMEKFDYIEGKDFNESELFDPIEFETKMREKARLNEDIVRTGIRLKSDIVVLRRKAYALDFKKYEALTQKLARFYMHNVCVKYPIGQYDASTRFSYLYNTLCSMITEELYEKDSDIEEKVEGIIYDTISKCLIFNQ